MPHLIVEHSNDLPTNEITTLITQLNDYLCNTGVFTPNDLKTRSYCADQQQIGTGSTETDVSDSYISLKFSLLAGRPDDVKSDLADNLYQITRTFADKLAETSTTNIQTTVEICDIDPNFYRK